jgi:hypothetical protein
MNKRLIIAKYKESIDWCHQLKDNFDIIIYNKDTNLPLTDYDNSPSFYEKDGIKYCDLPNIGREAHTYLYHIIHNYNTLSDIEIFTQGNPFDHSYDFINKLKQIEEVQFKSLTDSKRIQNSEEMLINGQDKFNWFYGNQATLYKDIFDKNPPLKYEIDIYAIFASSKECILNNKYDTYLKCFNKFNPDQYLLGFNYWNRNKNDEYFKSINEKYGGIPNGELFPHIFEYFWNLLFNQHRIIET